MAPGRGRAIRSNSARSVRFLRRIAQPHGSAYVGSVKTNIGHTEGAAGVAGVIKAALALRNERIPPSLHFVQPNPAVDWDSIPLRVPTTAVGWPRGDVPRHAAVSAFGIAGTNAHVVLEEAPAERARTAEPGPEVLLLSAATREALAIRARSVQEWISQRGAAGIPALGDLCYTAAVRRTHQEHRLAIPAADADELQSRLAAFAEGQSDSGCLAGRVGPAGAGRVVFVFPGQGSQWFGMGRDLLKSAPAFRAAIERCERAIQVEAGWSLLAELHADEASSRLSDIDVVQPVLFAIEVALAELWRAHGIEPAAVVGHSMGEVAAACIAGALSLEDGARVICRRSRLLREKRGKGGMALVELTLDEAHEALAGFEGRLSVAVSNSARSTVVAGDPPALAEFLAVLTRRDVFSRLINVDVASHSPQMDSLRVPLHDALAGLDPQPCAVPLHSTVDAAVVPGTALDADYWVRNLRQPVRFSAVVRSLLAQGPTTFIEMSPHPVLLPSIEQEAQSVGVEVLGVGSLVRNGPGRATFLESLARLHVAGHAVRWRTAYPQGRIVDLPAYPWQRERYWYEPAADAAQHPATRGLLGPVVTSSIESDTRLAEVELSLDRQPYLADHRVRGAVIVPAAAFIEIVCEAATRALDADTVTVQELRLEEALLLPSGSRRLVQIALTAGPPDCRAVRISSRAVDGDDETWTVHARGFVRAGGAGTVPAVATAGSFSRIRTRQRALCGHERPGARVRARFSGRDGDDIRGRRVVGSPRAPGRIDDRRLRGASSAARCRIAGWRRCADRW